MSPKSGKKTSPKKSAEVKSSEVPKEKSRSKGAIKSARYYANNPKLLREKARIRMQESRARKAIELAGLQAEEPLVSPSVLPKRHILESISTSPIFETLPPSSPPPPDRTREEAEDHFRLTSMRGYVGDWACEWGHPSGWAQRLREEYKEAASISEDAVADWVTHVTLHAYSGRHLVQALKTITDSDIPKHDWQIRELWRNTLDLLDPLYKGIAVIEAQVDLIRMSSPAYRG